MGTYINRKHAKHAGPGAWNDPDLLLVGVAQHGTSLSLLQTRTHFSLWVIMASPLILGNDFRQLDKIDPKILEIMMNKEVIDVNQDPLGIQGDVVSESVIGVDLEHGNCTIQPCVRAEVWVKPLINNEFAVLLFNRAGVDPDDQGFRSERITVDWKSHLNVKPSAKYLVRDLWSGRIYGVHSDKFTSDLISVQDVALLRFSPLTH